MTEILLSAGPLAVLWVGGWFAVFVLLLPVVKRLALLISVPSAFFVVRMFMIQHDCGHQAFFRSLDAQQLGGPRRRHRHADALLSCWKREHAIHHSTSGNLDRRGPGAIATMTIEEYRAASPLTRFGYRRLPPPHRDVPDRPAPTCSSCSSACRLAS